MRTIGRIFLWLFIGILGSAFIGFVAITSIEYQSLPKISSGGSVFTSFWDRGFVSATGTWIIDDTKQAFPRQTTEIKCYRDEKECLSAQAEITFGDTLSVQTERMRITSWDANSIVYASTEPTCVTYVYTITRASERVTGQRRPKQSTGDACKMLEQRVLNLTMRDGLQVWQQLQNEIAAKTYPLMWAALGLWWAFVIYRMVRRRTTLRLQNAV
jgi:hypothetical protein